MPPACRWWPPGTAPLSYQWFRNGVALDGATADTLEVPAATAADAGTYHVVVRNAAGQFASVDALMRREFAAPVLDAGGMPLTGIRAAGAALQASYAVRADGALLAWGSNFSRMLGDGTHTDRPLPGVVLRFDGKPLAKVRSVNGGVFHALALDADGCVHSWGDNTSFKLGINSILLERGAAGPVVTTSFIGLCGAKAIAGGYGEVSYAIDATGQLLGWGRNENGRLGDGTTLDQRLPVKVLVPGTMF